MNREPIRSPARSVANLEFHHTGDHVNEVARKIVAALEAEGVRAVNPAMGFPMEMDRFPGKIWVVSHKPVAVAAGLGQMGIHRNVIHPKFGNFILLGTVLIDAEVDRATTSRSTTTRAWSASSAWRRARSGPSPRTATSTSRPATRTTTGSSWAASPTGSSRSPTARTPSTTADGSTTRRSASMWQSLVVRAELQGGVLHGGLPGGRGRDRPVPGRPQGGFLREVVRPVAGEGGAGLRRPRLGRRGARGEAVPAQDGPGGSAAACGPGRSGRFLSGLPHVFQRHASAGLDATYHFTFTGEEPAEATVVDPGQARSRSRTGTSARPTCASTADSETWLGFLAKERSLVWACLRRKIRLKGSPRLLVAFGKCFPS